VDISSVAIRIGKARSLSHRGRLGQDLLDAGFCLRLTSADGLISISGSPNFSSVNFLIASSTDFAVSRTDAFVRLFPINKVFLIYARHNLVVCR
jgi:hypothetical protein